VDLGTTSTSDNCGVATVSNNAPATFPVGTTIVIWTVTDIYGNTAQCTQQVVVADEEDPSITCPANISTTADDGECFATVYLGTTSTSDNCGVATISNNAPATFPVGTTIVIWTVTDIYGNTAQCTQQIVVADEEDPSITCPANINTTTDNGECFATVDLGTTSTSDNCGVATVSNNAPATFPVGTTIVIWTVTDIYGNTAQCEQQVVIADEEYPSITCPANINTTTDDGECLATVDLGTPSTSDNCGVAIVSNNAPATFPVGTTIVIWTVTDIYGNTAQCEQQVVVADEEDPSITCPANISITNDDGECFATVDLGTPGTSDNCGVATVSNNAPPTFPVGITIVIWTVTDIYGNSNTCEMTVTVTDATEPSIICPENILFITEKGICEADIIIDEPEVSDNCGILTYVNSYNGTSNASGTYPVGITNVIWTVTDINSNASTCITNISVISPPLANDDVASTPQNTASDNINIIDNDFDCLNSLNTSTLIITRQPLNGSVIVNNATGAITYTPFIDFTGDDDFDYKVCNFSGLCDTATVYINITLINHPPVAENLIDSTLVNVPKIIDLNGHVSDPDGNSLTLSICSEPANGIVTINDGLLVTYTPYLDYEGWDSICYTVCDNGIPQLCDDAYIYIYVPTGREDSIIIYNTITPNGDGYNDFFYIEGIDQYPANELLIFNQWGDQIRSFRNYNNSDVRWDGTNKNGGFLPAGTYYYILKLEKIQQVYNGWVYIHH
ncbi:MAG: HYR domain-containing protein, partial [Bacteroidetes bacterium]|nr:HYR domain-containing protein [Bacteroidota bacterium]